MTSQISGFSSSAVAPKQLTRFSSARIFDSACPLDGKQLAPACGNLSAETILIKGFQ